MQKVPVDNVAITKPVKLLLEGRALEVMTDIIVVKRFGNINFMMWHRFLLVASYNPIQKHAINITNIDHLEQAAIPWVNLVALGVILTF
jgi:hypothetical protein